MGNMLKYPYNKKLFKILTAVHKKEGDTREGRKVGTLSIFFLGQPFLFWGYNGTT